DQGTTASPDLPQRGALRREDAAYLQQMISLSPQSLAPGRRVRLASSQDRLPSGRVERQAVAEELAQSPTTRGIVRRHQRTKAIFEGDFVLDGCRRAKGIQRLLPGSFQ